MITKIHHIFFCSKSQIKLLIGHIFCGKSIFFGEIFQTYPKRRFYSPQKRLFFMSNSQKQFESIKSFQHKICTFWFVLTQFHTSILDSNPKRVPFWASKSDFWRQNFFRVKKIIQYSRVAYQTTCLYPSSVSNWYLAGFEVIPSKNSRKNRPKSDFFAPFCFLLKIQRNIVISHIRQHVSTHLMLLIGNWPNSMWLQQDKAEKPPGRWFFGAKKCFLVPLWSFQRFNGI